DVGDRRVQHLHEGAERQRDRGDPERRALKRLRPARAGGLVAHGTTPTLASERFCSMMLRIRFSSAGPPSKLGSGGPKGGALAAASGPLWSRVSTVTFMEGPTRRGFCLSSSGSSVIRTGRRWTILIQFPDAFCGGRSEKALPLPAPRPCTRPWKTAPRP